MKNQESQPLLTIVGPTGVGKTAFAVESAKKINGELLSVDSRQIYIGMDIGTGKESGSGQWAELSGRRTLAIDEILIHGLDLVRPDEQFSVFEWHTLAAQLISEINERGKQPILVGGTGFYLNALQGNIESLHIDPDYELRNDLEALSTVELAQKLQSINADTFNKIDVHNKRKLIRAIEISKAEADESLKPELKTETYSLHLLGLTMNREELYRKADARIERMIDEGLVEETERLLAHYDPSLPSMTGIGYSEMATYLRGECSRDEAIQKMKYRVHAYIRRQYTWFRKQPVEWFSIDQPEDEFKLEAVVRQHCD